MKKKNLSIKTFAFFVLTCNIIKTVNAGQNIAKFLDLQVYSNDFATKSVNTYLYWLDANKSEPADPLATLSIQQNAKNYYYLFAYTEDSVNSIHAGIVIKDKKENVNDINFSSKDGNTCNFEYMDDKWLCKVMFNATESSPLDKETRYIHSYPKNNATADFYGLTQELSIKPLSEVGVITSSGPDGLENTLTGIAVSDDATNDKVPLTIKIDNAESSVTNLKFNFEFADTSIADADGKSIGSCEINSITQSSNGSCIINVTPKQIGKTQMRMLNTSYWTDKDKTQHYFSEKTLKSQTVEINIGTLFAGYNNLSLSKFMVYRKGLGLTTIPDESGEVIRGLAIDEPQHKLYIMSPKKLYKQDNTTASTLALTKLYNIPKDGGQTLSLFNLKNSVIIGTGTGSIYPFNEDNKLLPISSGPDSLINSTLDPANNILYFADSKGGLTSLASNTSGTIKTTHSFNVIPTQKPLLAVYKSKLYVAASTITPFSKNSKLYIWNKPRMTEVKMDSNTTDPFNKGQNITSLFFTRQGKLYATSNTGNLYYLSNRESTNPKWESVATISGIGFLKDTAIDANGNIYLASDKGIWKVPFNNQRSPYRLDNYESDVSAIVVDNNR
jgi:hypothetical protein